MCTLVDISPVFPVDRDAQSSIVWWNRGLMRLCKWRSHMYPARQLLKLNDHQLRDIGLTRGQAETLTRQSFRPLMQCIEYWSYNWRTFISDSMHGAVLPR